MKSIIKIILLSSTLLCSLAHINASAQAPFPANEQMCLLFSGMAGNAAEEREKGKTEEEMLEAVYYITKSMKADLAKDSLAVVQYVFKEKLRPMDARKDVYFMCKTGSYPSARLP